MYKILANTIFLGKDIICLPECHSTNDFAVDLYKRKEAKEGTIIYTDHQTGGRGQRGTEWHSQAGKNLTFSLVLTPLFMDATEQFDLNIAISLAIKDALDDYCSGVRLKWPNDIVHETGYKLGGILIENSISNKGIESAVVGIGLNVNQRDFDFEGPTSVAKLTGSEWDLWELFKVLISRIEQYYIRLKKQDVGAMRRRYLHHLLDHEKWRMFDDGKVFEGKITGVTAQGKLMVEHRNKEVKHYAFKEVKFL
ncbi:biotin--[acetyl-CoA-carboxylase] ligase [Pararhodonellum marinum]|uniref:biotin--[acetyl-CoA-carboxylase] ligase n=1 Tax=Pararhodonellum marinum TaxID=2755358 RepID=UPI0018901E3A|nr:biotin--[acetyl-CoA-carboxylase] ligase [Pararhodonellum marinum]